MQHVGTVRINHVIQSTHGGGLDSPHGAPHLPQAKGQAIALSSFEPPLAKQFALKQLKLMTEERLPQDAAFAKVEQELMPQLLALTQ